MNTIKIMESLEELGRRIMSKEAYPEDYVAFFYSLFAIENEIGQDIDIEAIGIRREQVKAWMEAFPVAVLDARQSYWKDFFKGFPLEEAA